MRRGLLAGDESTEAHAALDAYQAASVRNGAAMGLHAGRPLRELVMPGLASDEGRRTHERGVNGFDLDIGAYVRADERRRLEHSCRYLPGPALASDRLDLMRDGRVKYSLRHAWRDGTTAVIMEPLDLVARLAAL